MYAFVVQFLDFVLYAKLHYFMLFFILIWSRWVLVEAVATRYIPYKKRYKTKASVIIPVVDEPEELFADVLRKVRKHKPYEVIVVINGARNHELERVCRRFRSVKWVWTSKAGKRNALNTGLEMASGNVAVLVDSDTLWIKSTLSELMKPFADQQVGGVTTSQRIIEPDRDMLARFCSWMESIRAEGTMKAMSATGKVGCLPGRTIAFRMSVLRENMHTFMTEEFMGLHKEVSDDRSLTSLALKAGYKTVMQETSIVYTSAPEKWRKFIRQQLRWSEGSQYNNLRMSPWMFKKAPFMFFIFWSDTLIPFFLVGVFGTFALGLLLIPDYASTLLYEDNIALLLALTVLGSVVSIGLRHYKSFSAHPSQLLYIIPFIFVLTFVMAPIRIAGFAKLADDLGWGTRKSAYMAMNAQSFTTRKEMEPENASA